jgi:hypothetical protein
MIGVADCSTSPKTKSSVPPIVAEMSNFGELVERMVKAPRRQALSQPSGDDAAN